MHSPSKFGEKTLGINLHAFSSDARDNESELQKLKNNIELRMQSNSPDGVYQQYDFKDLGYFFINLF